MFAFQGIEDDMTIKFGGRPLKIINEGKTVQVWDDGEQFFVECPVDADDSSFQAAVHNLDNMTYPKRWERYNAAMKRQVKRVHDIA